MGGRVVVACVQCCVRLRIDPPSHVIVETLNDAQHVAGQVFVSLFNQFFWYLVISFGNASADGSLGVGIATRANGDANGVFKALTFQETADGPWNRFLTCAVKVSLTAYSIDVFQGWNVIPEFALDGTFYLVFRDATGTQQYTSVAMHCAPLMPSL